jgi:uncharacterized OsmC-like protein
MKTQIVSDADLDLTRPVIRKKALTARNDGTMRSVIDCGELGTVVTDEPVPHGGTGQGPSPLQLVVGALCGCESVTFNRAAREVGFRYSRIDFDAAFTVDIRGRMGVANVRPHFQTVRVQAVVVTSEPEERLREVVEETERRCPVFNLLRDANVDIETTWVRREPGGGSAPAT